MDGYHILLAVLGVAVLAAAVLPRALARLPLSLPIVIVAIGMAIFALPVDLDGPRPGPDTLGAERLTEFVVIVSLRGPGSSSAVRPVGGAGRPLGGCSASRCR